MPFETRCLNFSAHDAKGQFNQLIFGLDFPYNGEKETKLGIETIRSVPITQEEKELILGENLRREIGTT